VLVGDGEIVVCGGVGRIDLDGLPVMSDRFFETFLARSGVVVLAEEELVVGFEKANSL